MCCKFDEKTPMKILKRVSPVYFILQGTNYTLWLHFMILREIIVLLTTFFTAIYRFMETNGRIPKTQSAEQDALELEKIKNALMVELKLDKTVVDEDFAR